MYMVFNIFQAVRNTKSLGNNTLTINFNDKEVK